MTLAVQIGGVTTEQVGCECQDSLAFPNKTNRTEPPPPPIGLAFSSSNFYCNSCGRVHNSGTIGTQYVPGTRLHSVLEDSMLMVAPTHNLYDFRVSGTRASGWSTVL